MTKTTPSSSSATSSSGGPSLVRKPSPSRPAQEELTFQHKLSEIKRLREAGVLGHTVTPVRKVVINGKPAQKLLGDWAMMHSSRGRPYYFHLKSQVSQWTKPPEWTELEAAEARMTRPVLPKPLLTTLPPQPEQPHPKHHQHPVLPPPPPLAAESSTGANGGAAAKKSGGGFKMKIKGVKKKLKKKNGTKKTKKSLLPSAFLPAFEDEDEEEEEEEVERVSGLGDKSAKNGDDDSSHKSPPRLTRSRSRSPVLSTSKKRRRSSSSSNSSSDSSDSRRRSQSRDRRKRRSQSPPVAVVAAPLPPPPSGALPILGLPVEPVPCPDMSLVLAAKAKIESQMQSGSSLISYLDRNPKGQIVNPTWISEYNFPAVLSRCKFPKISDALHEMQTNRSKKRNPLPPPPPLPSGVAAAADGGSNLDSLAMSVRRDMFIEEIKHSNNRHRLLTEKLGQTVYKIQDELWDQCFGQFQIDLMQGVKLEARPHGLTEDNTPVYTRTGKVANKIPYPEDIVRCHAVVQAWQTQMCHCVYANKTYSIERDDRQWKKDLEDCRRFLKENGY